MSSKIDIDYKNKVRLYEGEWFSEGRVVSIENDCVVVDFLDWKQKFKHTELRLSYIHFMEIFVVVGPGEIVEDFR